MQAKYIIFDTYDGVHRFTDDDKIADQYSTSDDFFVVDLSTGESVFCGERKTVDYVGIDD